MLDPQDELYDRRLASHLVSLYHISEREAEEEFVVRIYVVVAVVYFILSRLLYLTYSANLGLLCMPHPSMGPLV